MPNPENNWVHVSFKAPNGAIIDARAEDADTMRALFDGAIGVGAYESLIELPMQAVVNPTVVENQAIQNLQNAGMVGTMPGVYRDQQQRTEPIQLGIDPVTGASVTLYPEGKFGPYVKDSAGTIASIPKGMHPSQCTIGDASAALGNKRQYNATKGR